MLKNGADFPIGPNVDRQLLARGLLSRLPDPAEDVDDEDDLPIPVEREPVSETIIRERR
jgi:hypothetical protein